MKKCGFTIIELVISLAVFVILTGGALLYINNFNSRRDLDLAAEEVAATLRMTRNYAITSQSPNNFTGELIRVGAMITNVGNTGIISGFGVNGEGVTFPYFEKYINNVNFLDVGETDIVFTVFEGKLLHGNESIGMSLVSSSGSGETRTIKIDVSGKIE